MKEKPDIRAITLGVIRGELALDTLTEIGIDISSVDGSYKLESGNFDVAVAPTASDLALGILRYTSRKKDELRKWAFFVLGECGAIDLGKIEAHPQGEVLIDALWDASFQGVIKRDVIALAEKIKLAPG
jgi:hypothetical protein